VAHVGRSLKRREDERFLQGRGAYVADIRRPFTLHMALVRSPFPHFHHLAFDYYDFGTLRSLFDNVAQHGRWLAWGPVRHGIAQNICGYVRITEEPLLVECYVDMEQLEPDHEPRQWPDDRFSSNTWGPLPPRSYFRFDEEAVRYERDSLEMLGEKLPPLEVHT